MNFRLRVEKKYDLKYKDDFYPSEKFSCNTLLEYSTNYILRKQSSNKSFKT